MSNDVHMLSLHELVFQASWDTSAGTYTETDLRNVFGKFGGVEDVILRPMKKKGKGSALVIMTNLQASALS